MTAAHADQLVAAVAEFRNLEMLLHKLRRLKDAAAQRTYTDGKPAYVTRLLLTVGTGGVIDGGVSASAEVAFDANNHRTDQPSGAVVSKVNRLLTTMLVAGCAQAIEEVEAMMRAVAVPAAPEPVRESDR